MTTRFCPRCDNEVEDAGGYCLLGHRLALEPLNASLSDLRAEIDEAFESARLEVAAVVAGTEITQPMRIQTAPPPPPPPVSVSIEAPSTPRRTGPPPPPPPRRAPRLPQPVEQAPKQPFAPSFEQAPMSPAPQPIVELQAPPAPRPAAPVQTPPPLPLEAAEAVALVEASPDIPDEAEILARKYPVWNELEEASPIIGDPIGAFAPPPHMDWGPEKSKPKLLKRKPSRQLRARTSEA